MSERAARSMTIIPTRLRPVDGAALVRLATTVMASRLTGRDAAPAAPESAALHALGASFVSIHATGALRGCIGSLEPIRPLYVDVARNAARAIADPRLPPVTVDEWSKLDVCVSALDPPAPLDVTGRDELIAALRPGIDGLILDDGERRATFLPAVWAKLPEPVAFVAALLAKGGWPSHGWPDRMRVARYTVSEFRDPGPRPPLT
jgi:AmmeMemoRadiSam system protein A